MVMLPDGHVAWVMLPDGQVTSCNELKESSYLLCLAEVLPGGHVWSCSLVVMFPGGHVPWWSCSLVCLGPAVLN